MLAEAGVPVVLLFWAYAVAAGAIALTVGIIAWWIAAHRFSARGRRLWVLAGALTALAPVVLRARSAALAEPPEPAPPLDMVPLPVMLYAGAGIVALAVAWVRSLSAALAAGAGAVLGWVCVKGLLLAMVVAAPGAGLGTPSVAWGAVPGWLLKPTLGSLVVAVLGGIAGYRIADRHRALAPD